jgi:hypothetical protein
MSIRVAAALAATIGAGMLMTTVAQARPEIVSVHKPVFAGNDCSTLRSKPQIVRVRRASASISGLKAWLH